MLVQITESCRMGCTHCMVDATPEGRHMTPDTFRDAVRFVESISMPLVMLSGGEPTDHPDIESFLELVRQRGLQSMVLSNGMFLHEDPIRRDRILELAGGVQITNDARFYPTKVPPFEHPKVVWESQIRVVSPFGRARANKLPCNRRSPMCFNLRSAIRHYGLREAIWFLRLRGNMCTPLISVEGNLRAGETQSCASFGHVTEGLDVLGRGLGQLTCGKCGLTAGLTQEQKVAIGEARILLV